VVKKKHDARATDHIRLATMLHCSKESGYPIQLTMKNHIVEYETARPRRIVFFNDEKEDSAALFVVAPTAQAGTSA
jgi:hypothetical protein